MGEPPWSPLRAEQAPRGLSPSQRRPRICAGERGTGRGELQFSRDGWLAMAPFDVADGGIGLA